MADPGPAMADPGPAVADPGPARVVGVYSIEVALGKNSPD